MSDNSFKLGRFVVRIGLRPDNPAFPTYLVYRRDKLIGKQFSIPSLTDCEWLERNRGYADQSQHASEPYGYTAETMRRRDRLKKEQENEEINLQEALGAA